MVMRVLKRGMSGPDVRKWQLFLIGQGFALPGTNGTFDKATFDATVAFQEKHGLVGDGIVGNRSFGQAMLLGFEAVDFASVSRSGFPPLPDFPPVGSRDRERLFGKFAFVHAPSRNDAHTIRITDGWDKENIVSVRIPQLANVKGAPADQVIRFHRLAKDRIESLWSTWDREGVLKCVNTWSGGFYARFVRGNREKLSNHAFGSAFDINAQFNPLGAEPAFPGSEGCVFDLVEIAHEHGFFWGGHFQKRRDGMHFEVAKL
jgi:hypothetical protein